MNPWLKVSGACRGMDWISKCGFLGRIFFLKENEEEVDKRDEEKKNGTPGRGEGMNSFPELLQETEHKNPLFEFN